MNFRIARQIYREVYSFDKDKDKELYEKYLGGNGLITRKEKILEKY